MVPQCIICLISTYGALLCIPLHGHIEDAQCERCQDAPEGTIRKAGRAIDMKTLPAFILVDCLQAQRLNPCLASDTVMARVIRPDVNLQRTDNDSWKSGIVAS